MLIFAFALQKNSWGASNVDEKFISVDSGTKRFDTINQDEFAGFSFVNDNFDPELKIC